APGTAIGIRPKTRSTRSARRVSGSWETWRFGWYSGRSPSPGARPAPGGMVVLHHFAGERVAFGDFDGTNSRSRGVSRLKPRLGSAAEAASGLGRESARGLDGR